MTRRAPQPLDVDRAAELALDALRDGDFPVINVERCASCAHRLADGKCELAGGGVPGWWWCTHWWGAE